MSLSVETLAVAKKYTDDSLAGAGAVAGVPCQIQSKTAITGGTRITFLWVDNNGDSHTTAMDVMNGIDGQDGKGIQSVSVNENNHLIITYSDGTTDDAGQIEIHSAVDSVNGQTGNVTLDAEDVGALPDDTPIPSKTSDLTNDSGFITKAVNDLVNYYLKSETYSKTEVDDIVTAIKNSRFEVVATLPTTDIKTNVIYLVPKSPSQTSNVKDEYINLDGTTAGWEKIGDTEIDLSDYVTTQALNTALANYTTTADLTTLLAGKTDKVSGATNGNFAGLNASGNLTDSGKKASDFASATALTDEIKRRFTNNCKNVLPIRIANQTARGVTFTRNANDSYSLSGTCTGNPLTIDLFSESVFTNTGDSSAFKIEEGINIDKTKPYILTRGDTQIRFTLALYQDGVSVATVGFDSTGGNPYMEIDFSSYTFNQIKAIVRFGNNTNYTSKTFTPMLCLKSDYQIDSSQQYFAKTNKQLTDDSVDWESNSVLGAKNFLTNKGTATTQGVEFAVDSNGVFTVTRKSAGSSHAYYSNGRFTLKPGTYIFSNGYNSLPSGIQATYLYNHTDGVYFTNCNNGPKTFTITEEKELAFNIEVQTTQSPSGVKIYPMIRLASDNDPTYQPYAKTNRELTEDTASAIANVPNGAINLAKPVSARTATVSNVEFVIDSEGKVTANGTASANIRFDMAEVTLKAGKTYKICEPSSLQARRPFFPETYRCYARIKSSGVWILQNNGWKGNYTPTEDVVVSVGIAMQSGNEVTDEIFAPMLVLDGIDVGDTFYPYAMTNRELTEKIDIVGNLFTTTTKVVDNITHGIATTVATLENLPIGTYVVSGQFNSDSAMSGGGLIQFASSGVIQNGASCSTMINQGFKANAGLTGIFNVTNATNRINLQIYTANADLTVVSAKLAAIRIA